MAASLSDKKPELRRGRQKPVKDLFDTWKLIGHQGNYFLMRDLVRTVTIPVHPENLNQVETGLWDQRTQVYAS